MRIKFANQYYDVVDLRKLPGDIKAYGIRPDNRIEWILNPEEVSGDLIGNYDYLPDAPSEHDSESPDWERIKPDPACLTFEYIKDFLMDFNRPVRLFSQYQGLVEYIAIDEGAEDIIGFTCERIEVEFQQWGNSGYFVLDGNTAARLLDTFYKIMKTKKIISIRVL